MVPTAVLSIIAFFILLLIVRNWKKTVFLFSILRQGMLNPSPNSLLKLNAIIKECRGRYFFLRIVHNILFMKVRFFLKRESRRQRRINSTNPLLRFVSRVFFKDKVRKQKLISSTNLLLRNLSKISLDKGYVSGKMKHILSKYDTTLQNCLYSYRSPKPGPVIELMHNISRLCKKSGVCLPLTLRAGQNTLMLLLGNPYVDPNLKGYKIDPRVAKKMKTFLEEPQQNFLSHIESIAA